MPGYNLVENQIIINNKLQNPGRQMRNTSQSTSVILTFMAPWWSIFLPPSLGISTGVLRASGTLCDHIGLFWQLPQERGAGDPPSPRSAIKKDKVGPQGWVPQTDMKNGFGFYSTRTAGAETSLHKHEFVGQYLWWLNL